MKFIITPQEPFFFKDARPFDKGEGWATGIFPPIPSTFYGALRTAAISQKSSVSDFYSGDEIPIRTEMGNHHQFGVLSLGFQGVAVQSVVYAPCPLDLLEKRYPGQSMVDLIPLTANLDKMISDTDLSCYKTKDPDLSRPAVPWVSMYSLGDYLKGSKKINGLIDPLWVSELKTGIQKDRDRGTAQEHMLYVQKMVRMKKDTAFCVDVNNCTALSDKGFLKLGHDGRIFHYQKTANTCFEYLYENNIINEIKTRITRTNIFKLFFTSPAFLKNGWLPGRTEKQEGKCYQWQVDDELHISIQSIVSDRPMRIGGWKLNKAGHGSPKPMYNAIAPGTVYYCKLEKGTVDRLFNTFFDKTFSDLDESYAKQGFGHTLIAAVNP